MRGRTVSGRLRRLAAPCSAAGLLLVLASEPTLAQEAARLYGDFPVVGGRGAVWIAAQLHLSVNTVKMYASQLYGKLGASRRTEAVARARELDLL